MTGPAPLTRIPDGELPEVGEFAWEERDGARFILLTVPTGGFVRLPVVQGSSSGSAWGWNGDLERPTLTPSILMHPHGTIAEWHGYLTSGVLTAVP